jgi:hypothetical protein
MHVEDKKMREFVDRIKDSAESMQEAMKILSLDLDYRRFTILPNVYAIKSGWHRSKCYIRMKTNDLLILVLLLIMEYRLSAYVLLIYASAYHLSYRISFHMICTYNTGKDP